MTRHLMIFTASVALAACSAAASPNTAITTQSGPDLMATLAPEASQPPIADEAPPPLIVPEAPAPAMLAPQTLAPKNVAPDREAPPQVIVPVQASFSCDIDIDRTSRGIRITPVVHADRAMSGEYSLVITKSGASGSSDINQGGPFDAGRGEEIALGASEFSLERGDRFRAVLKVRSGGREICRDVRS